MSAPIIKVADCEDTYDDPNHPIPSLSVVDINAVKKGGGSDLSIVIASPLKADERSQKRLLDKIDLYLRFLLTPDFQLEAGVASQENTSIIVSIHPQSD